MSYGLSHFAGSAGGHRTGAALNPLARASWLLFDRQGNLSPLVQSGRTTEGTYWDSLGVLRTAPANTPRVSYDPANLSLGPFLLAEEQRTNSIRNNTMQGAVAGVIGAGGSMPTNWSAAGVPGTLTRTVVGVGVELGITYVDIRFAGTTSSGGTGLYYDAANRIPATIGDVFSHSVFVSIVGGSLNNINAVNLISVERSSTGTGLIIRTTGISPNSVLQRYFQASTFTFADVAFSQPGISLSFASGVDINITLRIGLPQLEQVPGAAVTASSPILTFGTAVTRSADNLSVTNLAATGFNASEGTLYCDYQHDTGSSFPAVVALNNGTVQNRIVVVASRSTGIRGSIVNANATQADMSVSNYSANTRNRAALAFATDNFAFVATGNGLQRDMLGTVPTVTQLEIGRQTGGLNVMTGRIYQAAIIPQRVSDSGLQRMTRI